MNKSSIITLNPKIRSKGFKDENISLSKTNTYEFNSVFEKIKKVYEINNKRKINNYNAKIINKIYKSYLKFIDKKLLLDDEMILRKHEIEEFKRLPFENIHRYLVYRYRFNINSRLKIVEKYPPCVQIELTSICNYRCVMCYQADKTFSNRSNGFMGHMKFDTFKKCIDELEGNIDAITFASRGEPTLNQEFEKMLKYCEGKFIAMKLNTNASMLDEKLIHSILSSDLQTIVFSIDAKDKVEYEKIRVNGKFDKIIKNLELFNNIRNNSYNRNDKIVRISGVKINNDQSIDEMKKQWGDIADIVAFTNYIPWESSYENSVNDIETPCSELWSRLFVWQDGKVNPCDYDYKSTLSKWNIKDLSISEIWNSEYYNYLRYLHKKNLRNKIEPCRRCINA